MKNLFQYFLALALLSAGQATQASNNLYCDQFNSDHLSGKDFKKEISFAWTEKWSGNDPIDRSLYPQIEIVDHILAYQNERMLGCRLIQNRSEDPLYRNKRIAGSKSINISIAIGYNDQTKGEFVWDNYYYALFLKKLTQRCESQFHTACDFSLLSNKAESHTAILEKEIWGNKKLVLKIFKAAITNDNSINKKNPEQQEQSLSAEKKFHESFTSAQFIFYLGHSRNGGGPDFFPAVLLPNGRPNYSEYNAKKIKTIQMTSHLRKLPLESRPLFFGLLGCDSRLHFYRRLREVLPNSTLMTSRKGIFSIEFYEGVLTLINGLHFKKSATEMNLDLEATNIARRSDENREQSLLFLSAPTFSAQLSKAD